MIKKTYPLAYLQDKMYMVDKDIVPGVGEYTFLEFAESPNDNEVYKRKEYYYLDEGYKIFASTNKSLALPLLPEAKESVYSIAEKDFNLHQEGTGVSKPDWVKIFTRAANDKRWSDDDMRNLWQYVVEGAKSIMLGTPTNIGTIDEYLDSLIPKPIAVEVEMEEYIIQPFFEGKQHNDFRPKVDENNFVKVLNWIYE